MRIITLRSAYKTLSVSEVQSMPNVSIRKKIAFGFHGHSTVNHDYNIKTVGGDVVVVDNATGLMWHQGGSDDGMYWYHAKKWVEDLNYAGYHDWRLPTVDEAASLLESSKMNSNLYIDPVFSKKQKWTWTGDKFEYEDGSEAAWLAGFNFGQVFRSIYHIDSNCYVRPVRSME